MAHREGALAGEPVKPMPVNVRRGTNGKPLYVPILEWADRPAATAFSHAVVAAVLAEHPDALDGEAQP